MRNPGATACPARTAAEPNGYRVVRSSYGRVRVHLDDWASNAVDELIARLQVVPGVTSAVATSSTQNILILYEPRQHDLATLLTELGDAWQRARQHALVDVLPFSFPLLPRTYAPTVPVGSGAGAEPSQAPVSVQPVYVTGIRRTLYTIFGWTSVGMAVVGAITPGIPTAPFVILAGYFFIRSSPAAHQWLRQSRWFGELLRDWEEYHGVRRSIRNLAVGLIGFSMIFITFIGLPLPLVLTIHASQIAGLVIVLRLRVVENPSPIPALVAP